MQIYKAVQSLISELLQFWESETADRRLEPDSGEAGSETLCGVGIHSWSAIIWRSSKFAKEIENRSGSE
jgi:hypothetical protein